MLICLTGMLMFLNLSSFGDTKEVVVEDFEKNIPWKVSVAPEGAALWGEIRSGAPFDLKGQKSVMGVKIETLKCAPFEVRISPPHSISLPPDLVFISFWVQGMNRRDLLKLSFSDGEGREIPFKPYAHKLNYMGWKKIVFYLSPDLLHFSRFFQGFLIKINPLEINGEGIYIYFDQIVFELLEERIFE